MHALKFDPLPPLGYQQSLNIDELLSKVDSQIPIGRENTWMLQAQGLVNEQSYSLTLIGAERLKQFQNND